MNTEPTVIEYNGVKFRRYPHSSHRCDQVYFTPGVADRLKGIKRLHEELWIEAHGPIPGGHHIHHRDGNPLNNDIENLESLPSADHMRHHHAGVASERKLRHLERIRPLAAEWHSTPEGLAWHSQHAYKSMLAVEAERRECEQCGKMYEARPKSTLRFCSNACKSAWRRKSGLDDVNLNCAVCETPFTKNRYSKTQTCSRKCAGVLISRAKTSKS